MIHRQEGLVFLPLGGTGEIGMNLNLYGCDGAWLAIDCGLGFAESARPDLDIMVPDPSFIAERRDALVGLVITHAHEDHIGAVAWLWPQLQCPVYATPFAAAVLRRKLGERGLAGQVPLHEFAPGASLELGPFSLRFISMAHSIPEAQAVVIDTPHGRVLHTGDWKLDPDPLVGPRTDEAALAAVGEQGVDVLVCDSTNAMVEGHSGSEADVRRTLAALVRGLRGRVAFTCFSSNIARIESIALAAEAAGRSVALVGRSLRNIAAAARETGYLNTLPAFVEEEEAGYLPDDSVLFVCAGSQGEPRSALSRIAADTHPNVSLGEGDTVIYSSRVIPGNERAILMVQDALARRGVTVMTEHDHMVHVSGHPARDELRRLYRLVKPKHVVPVHGEWRHMSEHAALARELGAIPHLIEDGDMLRLAPGAPEVVESVPAGRLAVDGVRLLPVDGPVLAERRRMLESGLVVASLAVDRVGRLVGEPVISAPGLFTDDEVGPRLLVRDLGSAIAGLSHTVLRDDEAVRDAAAAALRSAVRRAAPAKRPVVSVHVLRV
ncbi:ribonuclease J [Elioraea rosea]|uniref:ribonuclease J n=1 Tax=Elioraea rosea TaxID=2492390 RepID=UPI001181EB88|nr:ribonuclease J [Elioraea rosea]